MIRKLVFTLIALATPVALAAEKYTCSFSRTVVASENEHHEIETSPWVYRLEATAETGRVSYYMAGRDPSSGYVGSAQVLRHEGLMTAGPLPGALAPRARMVTFLEAPARGAGV